MEESGEVEDVRPEEHAPGGPRTQGEAEEPLERGGPGPPPRPPCVTDLRGGGEECPGENGGGDEGHAERVRGGDRPQG